MKNENSHKCKGEKKLWRTFLPIRVFFVVDNLFLSFIVAEISSLVYWTAGSISFFLLFFVAWMMHSRACWDMVRKRERDIISLSNIAWIFLVLRIELCLFILCFDTKRLSLFFFETLHYKNSLVLEYYHSRKQKMR